MLSVDVFCAEMNRVVPWFRVPPIILPGMIRFYLLLGCFHYVGRRFFPEMVGLCPLNGACIIFIGLHSVCVFPWMVCLCPWLEISVISDNVFSSGDLMFVSPVWGFRYFDRWEMFVCGIGLVIVLVGVVVEAVGVAETYK